MARHSDILRMERLADDMRLAPAPIDRTQRRGAREKAVGADRPAAQNLS